MFYLLRHFTFKHNSLKKITSGMTARHAHVKKKHHKHRYKVNQRNASILKIRASTMKYSYIPELSNIFYLGREKTTIFSYTEKLSFEIIFVASKTIKTSLINKSKNSDNKWCNTEIKDLKLHSITWSLLKPFVYANISKYMETISRNCSYIIFIKQETGKLFQLFIKMLWIN